MILLVKYKSNNNTSCYSHKVFFFFIIENSAHDHRVAQLTRTCIVIRRGCGLNLKHPTYSS